MSPNEFDRSLMEDLSQLPPAPGEVESYTPWRAAMTKILWGMGLTTFRFEFFYLHYILPLLGAALLYLGYRTLRRENRWFRLCWVLSGVLLAVHMATDILTATPVMGWITQNPALNWGLTWPLVGMQLLLLFALWRGTRAAFASVGEAEPRDWLKRGLVCYLLSLAIALWSELVPLTQDDGFFGPSILEQYEWLYYGRSIAFIALQIYLLVCIARQSGALADRGYAITPVPVRFAPRTVLLGVFGAVLLSLPIALWFGGHIPTGPAEPVPALTAEQTAVRDHLVSLGLPEDVAAALDGEELERCAQAVAVETGHWSDLNLTDDDVPLVERDSLLVQAGDAQARLSIWLVFLPHEQVRWYHFFQYETLPSLRLQEQFSVIPSSNYPADGYSGRLLWVENGVTYAASPDIQLAGGQTAEELTEGQQWWYELELERLGHLQYTPYLSFSIPRQASAMGGYLAYTTDASTFFDKEDTSNFYDFVEIFLRHQSRPLHYPFSSIDILGGSSYYSDYGPFCFDYGNFYFEAPFPQ